MSNQHVNSLYVNRDVQKAYLCRSAWHWCCLLLGVTAAVIVTHLMQTALVQQGSSLTTRCTDALRENAFLLAMIVCLAPIFLRDSWRVSRRLVAPLADIHAAVEDLASGKSPARLNPREFEGWEDFANAVNRIEDRIARLESPANAATPVAEPAAEPACV